MTVWLVWEEVEDGMVVDAVCLTQEIAKKYMDEHPKEGGYYPSYSPAEFDVIDGNEPKTDHLWYANITKTGPAEVTRGDDEDMETERDHSSVTLEGRQLELHMTVVAKTRAEVEEIITRRRDEMVRNGTWVYRE